MSSALTVREQTGVAFTTADAVQVVAATIATDTDTGYKVRLSVVAVQTDDYSQIAALDYIAAFKNDGGVLAQVGSTSVLSSIKSNGAWDVAFAVSGTTIQVKVTGAAGTNIAWLIDSDVKNLHAYYPNGGIIG